MNHAKPSLSVDKVDINPQKSIQPTMSEPDHPTVAINRSLHRLPLILDILDEIEDGISHPGDDDLRQGSHQAVRSMVEHLVDIKPRHTSEGSAPTTTEVEMATTWLLGKRPRKLLPPSLYTDLSQSIQRLVPENAEVIGEQKKSLS